jgi:transcriptional antiterminator NusG
VVNLGEVVLSAGEEEKDLNRASAGAETATPGEEEKIEETPPPATDSSEGPPKHWYVVHTYSGHENKVKTGIERAAALQELEQFVGRVLVATENIAQMKDGKKTVVSRKFFPSYVLVELALTDETLHLVANTPGVTKFVGAGKKPMPLAEEEVERVLAQMGAGTTKPETEVPFRIGEHVKVVDGPFTDFTGVVDEINPERSKVKVMVSIFGRATPVELDFLQVTQI